MTGGAMTEYAPLNGTTIRIAIVFDYYEAWFLHSLIKEISYGFCLDNGMNEMNPISVFLLCFCFLSLAVLFCPLYIKLISTGNLS